MPKSSIARPPAPAFLFFAGKGGVGKTTCAAASALAAARAGQRVLLLSTDPAHSLGDVVRKRLGARVTSCPSLAGRGWLGAAEIDAGAAFRRWLRDHRSALADIVEHGTWLDRADADALMQLTVPGVDELMGMIEILRLAAGVRPACNLVVVDTAPTGHTLRLFKAPHTVADVAGVLDRFEDRHRVIREQFGRSRGDGAADRLIATLEKQAAEALTLLRDPDRTSIAWVTIPEMLAYDESVRAIGELRSGHIRVSEVIINRMTPEGVRCSICDRRRAAEQTVVSRLCSLPYALPVRRVRTAGAEPRGARALSALARDLKKDDKARATRSKGSRIPPMALAAGASSASVRDAAKVTIASLGTARMVFVAGKGGVGKTTVAAAVAGQLARAGRRVLLLSTDPAPSIGDLLGARVTDRTTSVPGAGGRLFTRAIDATAAFSEARAELERGLAQLANTEPDLLTLAPPGVDELFGLLSLADFVSESGNHDTLVVDTAPTGHALRLLETPELTRAWIQTLMRILLKYRNVVGLGALAQELLRLSQSIGRLQALLRDPSATRVVVVTRAAAVPRLETERLLERLRALRLAVHALVVNALTLKTGACRVCSAIARNETREVRTLERALRTSGSGCAIIHTALASPPPRGMQELERWSGYWVQHDGAQER